MNYETSETHFANLRLFIEDVACDNSLFKHVVENNKGSSTCKIDREYYLGVPRTFADIRIGPADEPEYFIEVKFGYSDARLLDTLSRKYSIDTPQIRAASKLLILTSNSSSEFELQIKRVINPCLHLEVWTEATLKTQIRERLGITIPSDLLLRFPQDCAASIFPNPLSVRLPNWLAGFTPSSTVESVVLLQDRPSQQPSSYRINC